MIVTKKTVAPFVGVWVEIAGKRRLTEGSDVAPFVGVWVEIHFNTSIN